MSYQNIDKPYESTGENEYTSGGGGSGSEAVPQNPYSGSSGVSSSVSGGAFSAGSIKEPKTILRLVQAFLDIVVFSCVAAGVEFTSKPEAWNTFLLFVGVTALIFDLIFIILYFYNEAIPSSWESFLPVGEFGFTALWAFFYFAGSIAYAVNVNKLASSIVVLPGVATARAGAAFGFFSWIAWSGSAFFAFQRWRGVSSAAAPVHYNDL